MGVTPLEILRRKHALLEQIEALLVEYSALETEDLSARLRSRLNGSEPRALASGLLDGTPGVAVSSKAQLADFAAPETPPASLRSRLGIGTTEPRALANGPLDGTPGVAVISSEPVVAEGFRSLLAGSGLHLAVFCGGIAEFLQTAAPRPEVVVWHTSSPVLEEIASLRRRAPECAIVLWLDKISMEMTGRAVELGVRGILRTSSEPGYILESLRAILRGEVRLELPAAGGLPVHAGMHLSNGQRRLLTLVGQGLKNKEIATLLGSTEGTVKTSLNRLFRSLGVKDRLELALYSFEVQAHTETNAITNNSELWKTVEEAKLWNDVNEIEYS